MFLRLSDFISKHLEKIVLILAIALSIASFVYYYHAGLITAYGDSRGHLNIARRVVDSLSPGIAQLGGYWLPLLHILMLPTIWSNFMWQSGISGALPNMIAFVLAVFFMYRLVLYITKDKLSAFIGASVLLFNPNLLYMQTTPMTESLFVGALVGFMYFFYRWFQEKSISDLIFAALFLILASLNRYEGWGLVIAANTLMVWYWVQTKFDRKIEGSMFAFASLSFLGIFLWLLWGAVIFHDPFEFLHNAVSATNQTKIHDNWIGLHNVQDATMANIYAVIHVSGWIISIIGGISFLLYFLRNYRSVFDAKVLVILLFLVPFLFDTLTVYTGNVPVEVPEMSQQPAPGNYFNIRYALYSLPLLAVVIAIAFQLTWVRIGLLCIVIFFNVLSIGPDTKQIVTLRDVGANPGSEGYHASNAWLRSNYSGGLILASTGGSDSWMFRTEIEQHNWITEGSLGYWAESMADPSRYADWVMISNYNYNDAVRKNINYDELERSFEVVYSSDSAIIYKKIIR